MLHKISEFCDKIDAIKKDADRLRNMKYGPVKANDSEINHAIETIQHQCYMVSQDKGEYEKHSYGDYSGIDHDSVFINEKE
tara:strand:+ start:308 stop:550 length:243 start_codon:yes stop_codon:yes gene_type:complete